MFEIIAVILSGLGNSIRGGTTSFGVVNGKNNLLIRSIHFLMVVVATYLISHNIVFSLAMGVGFYIWNLLSWGAWMYMGEYIVKDENHERLDRVLFLKPLWVYIYKSLGKPKDTVVPDFICMTIRNIYSSLLVLVTLLVYTKSWVVIPLFLLFNTFMSMAYVIGHKVLYEDHKQGHQASELISGVIQMLLVVLTVNHY